MTSRSAEPVTTGAPALEIQDVVAGYGGGDVLHGVTMQVYEGGITCVVGPNGAGKSTLLGTISGLLNPRLGPVSLRGERLSGKSPRQVLDMGVVLVPQNHSLFREMTVRENIMLGGYILRQRGPGRPQAGQRPGDVPQVTDWLGKKAGSLSGGQQRLVEFARCLMLDPQPGHPGRAVHGPVTQGAQVGVRRDPDDERPGQDHPAGGAERAGRAAAVHARGGAGERARSGWPARATRCCITRRSAPCTWAGR